MSKAAAIRTGGEGGGGAKGRQSTPAYGSWGCGVCIAMLESLVSTARNKHIDICHHFVCKRVELAKAGWSSADARSSWWICS